MQFRDPRVVNRDAVEARSQQLMVSHRKQNDCRILAEAEDLELDTILTYDHDFRQRLDSASPFVRLMTPLSYWTCISGLARSRTRLRKWEAPDTSPRWSA